MPNQSYITKYTSGKLLFTFVIMFSFFCKYLYILSLFIAPFIKKKITYVINRDARAKWKCKVIFEKNLLRNLMLHFAIIHSFVQNLWVVHKLTHEKEKNNKKNMTVTGVA